MKKPIALLAALLALAASCVSLASHRVEEAGMSVSLPQDWALFTPGVPDDDPGLELLDLDGPTLRKAMEVNHIALNAVAPDRAREVSVQCFSDKDSQSIFNYKLVDKKKLTKQAQALVDHDFSGEEAAAGMSYDSYEVYEGAQAYFLCFTGRADADGTQAAFMQYATVVNGYAINISLREYHDGALSEDGAALLRQIAESVVFDQILEKTISPSTIAGVVTVAVLFVGICVSLAYQIKKYRKNRL